MERTFSVGRDNKQVNTKYLVVISAVENKRAQEGDKKSPGADKMIRKGPKKKVICKSSPAGGEGEPDAHLGGKCSRQLKQQVQRP